jgi:protein-S-isoprenylcysteine O-methyltransferase Ste14
MSAHLSNVQNSTPDLTPMIIRRFIQIGLLVVIQAAALFLPAWDITWTMAWIYLGIYLALIAVNSVIMLPRRADLIAERAQIKEDAKGWDKIIGGIASISALGILFIAGIDWRLGWQPDFSVAAQGVGLALYAGGFAVFLWAMASNRFFSGVVRIQKDRGHTVQTGGPYRIVRHPGYAAIIAAGIGTALLLGSPWSLIPSAVSAAFYVVRTALEDRTLRAELPGYEEYTQQTRYRLLPGIW